jgi:hypothetical protein
LQDPKIYKKCAYSALNELTQRKNTNSIASLSRYFEEIKKFCGAKWQQLPNLGMTDEDFSICSSRGRIDQEIVIEQDGLFATLYILNEPINNKVYSIDGVIRKITTSSKIRAFR